MDVEVVDDLVVLVVLVDVVVRGVLGNIESQIEISMVHNACFQS